MSVADDLKEREQAAGNAETESIGQAHYDEEFNKIAKNTENEDFDDIIDNNYGDGAADEKVDAHGDKIRRNYNADEPEDSRDTVKGKEENPESLYNNSSDGSQPPTRGGFLGRRLKKFTPFGGIVGLILFAVVGVSGGTDTLAASLLINFKEMLHNDRSDGTRANQIFARATIAKKIDYKGAGCGTIAIKCRMGTMSDTQRQNYERAGFKVEGKAIGTDGKVTGDYKTEEQTKTTTSDTKNTTGNRYIVDRITFPDGKIVTSGDGFFKYTQANVKMRVASVKAFNPRSAFFLNERSTAILNKTFKFSKGNTLSGKTKEEIDKSFNDKTGGATNEEIKAGTKSTKTEEEAKKLSSRIKEKVGGAADAVATGACQAYNLSKYGIAAIKTARMYELVSFALPWLQAADQIKDQGKIAPEIVDNLSSRLVSYQHNKTLTSSITYDGVNYPAGSPNPKYNLTATDGQGYQLALGDRSKLKDFARTWLLGGNKQSTVNKIQGTLTSINSAGGIVDSKTGAQAIRLGCKILNSPQGAIIGVGAVTLDCLTSIIGNEATGPQGCATAVGWLLAGAGATIAINELGQKLIEYAAQEAVNNLNLGSDLNGVDAGDAMAAGAGLMLGTQATSAGLQPSKSVTDTQNYIAQTEDVNNQYIAAEQYNARDTPFDIYNQYSFLGSIVSKMQPVTVSQPSLFSSVTNLSSIFSSTLATGSDTANALYSQPSSTQTERYNCNDPNSPEYDPDLAAIGAVGDKFCSIATLMPTKDLQAAQAQINGGTTIDDVIDYMTKDQKQNEADGGTADDSFGGDANYLSSLISSQPNPAQIHKAETADEGHAGDSVKSMGRSIDDTGKPILGSQYSLYLEYCTDARVTDESQTTWDGDKGAGMYWGTSKKDVDEGSNRDQDWYTGKQCTDPINSKMMSMFRQYTNYCLQTATMDGTDNCWDTATASNAALVTSDAGVCGLVNNPNITYTNPKTKADLEKNCAGQTVINVCGQPMTIDPQLAKTINTLSSKYKILINNFGYGDDRSTCDTGQHPKGKAIDINGIEMADGSGGTGTGITYGDPAKDKVLSQFATDWINTLPAGSGGIGQKGCSSTFQPTLPSGDNGGNFFSDSCDHLHIDVRGSQV
ncbi:MAG: peptidase [Candidatus Saccharibacteria bacterium]|nr:peptidase [Candidatus Saccharibacteria bacterium]